MKDHKELHPESMMMSHGYKPSQAEGAVKAPIYQTSTFAFKSSEEGKEFFEIAYGLKQSDKELGMIYSRLDNPNLDILEKRLALWDKADDSAVFASGMAAITTAVMEFVQPGKVLFYSSPLYGGTDHFIKHALPKFGIKAVGFKSGIPNEEIDKIIKENNIENDIAMIYAETPANPTNAMVDIEYLRLLADKYSTEDNKVILSIDNTFMGPLWQHPMEFGADLVIYSATKYIGGHSDVVAGVCSGSNEIIGRIKGLRTFFGGMATPFTSWLLSRSLETLKVRMECQANNAEKVANYLKNHPKVEKVYYLGFTEDNNPEQLEIFRKQYLSAGAVFAFDIKGEEKEAFRFLDNLKLFKLAVSLGSTESLAEHPYTMTHADVSAEDKQELSISEKMVRLSIGIENADDIIADIEQAFDKV